MINQKEFEKRIKDSDTVIAGLINEKKIITGLSGQEKTKFVNFYRKQANLSVIAADLLYDISTEKAAKEFHKLDLDYEGFLCMNNLLKAKEKHQSCLILKILRKKQQILLTNISMKLKKDQDSLMKLKKM